MQHNTEKPSPTASIAQAFKFLGQLGLQGVVLYGEDVDAQKSASQRTYLNAVAKLPAGNPASALLKLTQDLQGSVRLKNRGIAAANDTVKPREIMLYDGPRFGVVIGNTRLMVEVSDKPTNVHKILAAQPPAQQVAIAQTQPGTFERTETEAYADRRMKAELALL